MGNDNNNLLFSQEEMERMEPNNLFHPDYQKESVTCLGMTFDSDAARRDYFREELRKKLPELKLIEGFPIGEDDDIPRKKSSMCSTEIQQHAIVTRYGDNLHFCDFW